MSRRWTNKLTTFEKLSYFKINNKSNNFCPNTSRNQDIFQFDQNVILEFEIWCSVGILQYGRIRMMSDHE